MNHAYLYGGAPLTLKTLNYNYDLDVTRYVAFNFDAKATKLSYQELLTLLDTCLLYIETNLSLNDIISYGTKVLTFDLKNIEQLQVPSNGYDDINHSVSYKGFSPLYVMNNYQNIVKEIHKFIYDDTEYQPSQTVIETEAAIYDKFGYVR